MKKILMACLFAAFLSNMTTVTALAADEWQPLDTVPIMYGEETTYCENLLIDDYYIDIDMDGLIK